MLYSRGGQLDGLREPHLGSYVVDSDVSICQVKRMAATLRTEETQPGRSRPVTRRGLHVVSKARYGTMLYSVE